MSDLSLAPLILFVYNRPWHTQQTVEALLRNPLAQQTELYVFADGAKQQDDPARVAEVRQYVKGIKGFRNVLISESKINLGLAKSVIAGVSSVLVRHENAIVMEDDLVCSTDFLDFMNQALKVYQFNPAIFSVSGYTYPIREPQNYRSDVYLFPRASSWGWGTWTDRWQQADWNLSDFSQFIRDKQAHTAFMRGGEDLLPMLLKQQLGKIDSWAIRWTYAHYKHNAGCLSPVKPKIHSIGADNSGTHLGNTKRYAVQLSEEPVRLEANIAVNEQVLKSLQSFFRLSLIRRLINLLTLR